MSNLSRAHLKAKFQNGRLPSQKDFCDLIDSCLNKRDDDFFGLWQPGTEYCIGDVVLYKKGLYVLTMAAMEDCPPDEAGKKGSPSKPEAPKCMCSTEPPDLDHGNWCPVQVDADDDDWQILKTQGIMYAEVHGKIGMGTKTPAGQLDITEAEKGQYLFGPAEVKDPTFKITNLACPDNWVEQSVDEEHVVFKTKGCIGFMYKKLVGDDNVNLVLITTDRETKTPMMGIGTDEPKAMLDLKYEEKGQILLNPGNRYRPELVLRDLDDDEKYLASSVGKKDAALSTNAAAIHFKFDKDFDCYCLPEPSDFEKSQMVLQSNGNLGLGTETPESAVEIFRKSAGHICLDMGTYNPAISLINFIDENPANPNYHLIGATDECATFCTSSDRFSFRRGGEHGKRNNEKDPTQGERLFEISTDGRIGVNSQPGEATATINGTMLSYQAYEHAPTDENTDVCRPLTNVLDELCNLKVVTYKWSDGVVANGDDLKKIGLDVDDCYHFFPETVRDFKGEKGISTNGMLAVTIRALQEATALIVKQEQRICDLEAKVNK